MGSPHTSYIQFEGRVSVVTPIATTTVDVVVDPSYPHCFAGVVFYSDAEGATQVTPSGGTVTITVETYVQPGFFQTVTNGTYAVTAAGQVDWAANTTRVRATIASITGATHYRLITACNSA